MDVLKAHFTASNTVRGKRPYTIYEIEVRSMSTINWVIYKRYSEFYTLNQELSKAFLNSPKLNVELPVLPPKRLTRSLAVEFVERRLTELQQYLRALLEAAEIIRTEPMLNFLEIPASVRAMILAPTDDSEQSDSKHNEDGRRNRKNLRAEEQKVLDLVHQLKTDQNKVTAIKGFEAYFFDQRPRLSSEYIKILFQDENEKGGLIATCGDFKYSHVASRAALNLLVRLLDIEKNKDAQLFLDTFTSLDMTVLKELNLHEHILSERGNRVDGFRLVSIIETKLSTPLSVYVPDTWARQAYSTWAERQSKSISTSTLGSKGSRVRALNIADSGPKIVAQDAFEELSNLYKSDSGWRAVGQEEDNPVHLHYKKDNTKDLVMLRTVLAVPINIQRVFKFLLDCSRYKEWNLKWHSGRVVKQYDDNTQLTHCVFKTFSSPYKYRDFCLLRSWREHDGHYTIVHRSVTDQDVPEQKDHVRAILLASGFQLEPCTLEAVDNRGEIKTIDSCIVTFTAQMDRESVMIVSPDLLGETNELFESMLNITECLEQDEQKAAGGTARPWDLKQQTSTSQQTNNTRPNDASTVEEHKYNGIS